jgi:drug/metabolite transporter (DMT)-like permease
MIKKMTNKMNNYPVRSHVRQSVRVTMSPLLTAGLWLIIFIRQYFLSQLTTFVYLPIFFGIVFYEYRYTNFITPQMSLFPKYKFAIMGLFDALSGICVLFGGVHTSGSNQALLNNAVIPFTMALSMAFLGTRYLRSQHMGAILILLGVGVVLIPLLAQNGNDANSDTFNVIYLLSTVPQAFSSIYKEIAFGDYELDVNFLQAWVALFQFVIGILLAPINALPFLQDVHVPFNQMSVRRGKRAAQQQRRNSGCVSSQVFLEPHVALVPLISCVSCPPVPTRSAMAPVASQASTPCSTALCTMHRATPYGAHAGRIWRTNGVHPMIHIVMNAREHGCRRWGTLYSTVYITSSSSW